MTKTKQKKTVFERDVAAWMKEPGFARSYREARAEIAASDEIMRQLLMAA